MEKTYEEIIKQKAYEDLAKLLFCDYMCRRSNWYCIKKYYHEIYHTTIDDAIGKKEYLQPSTIERMIRQLKRLNHKLQSKKDEDEYKQISIDIPAVKVTML